MDEVRGKLSKLAGHAAVAAEVDGRIEKQAAARVDAITARLEVLSASALTVPDDEDEYLRLVEERGRLQRLLGQIRK